MLLAPVWVESGFNWTGLAITLIVLALGWTILRFVLRLTLRIFALGGIALLILVGLTFVLLYGK